MKKIVTALMILLPLVFLVTLFTVTGITSITTRVAVTGISLADKGEGIFAFDIATYQPFNQSELGITVYPAEAKNKDYTLSVTDAKTGEPSEVVTVDRDGNFVLNDTGLVKLTYTTVDGGYTDSVLFSVSSSGVLDFRPTLQTNLGEQVAIAEETDGYTASLACGTYQLGTLLYPQATIAEQVAFDCDSEGVKLNSLTGEISFQLSGSYAIDVTVKGIKGDITHTLYVDSQAQEGALTVNGYANLSALSLAEGSRATTVYLETEESFTPADLAVEGGSIEDYSVNAIDGHRFAVTLRFVEDHPQESTFTLRAGGNTHSMRLQFVERTFYVYAATNPQGVGDIVMLTDSTTALAIDTDGGNFSYEWTLFGQNGATLSSKKGSKINITSAGAGKSTLAITAYLMDEEEEVVDSYDLSRTIVVTPRYNALLFAEQGQDTALSDCLAVAGKTIDDEGNVTERPFRPTLLNGTTPLDHWADLQVESSAYSLATVKTDGDGISVDIKASGKVTLTATWIYASLFGVEGKATYTFMAVDGVQADTYKQLVAASQSKLPVVLGRDLWVGEDLFRHDKTVVGGVETTVRTPLYDNATMAAYLNSWTHTIPTTWDWTFYKNTGRGRPDLRYVLEFSASVYGNGHSVSCEYVTDMLDDYGNLYDFAVFRGPLDFVSANDKSEGISLAAVKGQDNICFLVRQDGVTLENLVLKGCDDEALYVQDDHGDKQIDLTRLNYCGTTLELMANVNLHACRVQNGRTVVRAYGRDGINTSSGAVAQVERMEVNIENSVLANAREFVLKLGTNRYLAGTKDLPDPSLTDQEGNPYTQFNTSKADALYQDRYFYDHYVLTDVTVKNTTLATSGLFTVGLESHFAGPMLMGVITIGKSYVEGWDNLAATSYAAALHLVGDVKLSDWKDIANVDSSTLIETPGNLSDSMAFLKLDVGSMISAVKDAKYAHIVKEVDGKTMAHGGIALYGGGKNYHVVDTHLWDYASLATTYQVNLSVLKNSEDPNISAQGEFLPLAAGTRDFRFIMYDANSYEQTVNQ